MPMEKPEDFANSDPAKDYCRYCVRPDGSMLSYGEKLDNMTEFMIRTQGFDPDAARSKVAEMLRNLPAWKDR